MQSIFISLLVAFSSGKHNRMCGLLVNLPQCDRCDSDFTPLVTAGHMQVCRSTVPLRSTGEKCFCHMSPAKVAPNVTQRSSRNVSNGSMTGPI